MLFYSVLLRQRVYCIWDIHQTLVVLHWWFHTVEFLLSCTPTIITPQVKPMPQRPRMNTSVCYPRSVHLCWLVTPAHEKSLICNTLMVWTVRLWHGHSCFFSNKNKHLSGHPASARLTSLGHQLCTRQHYNWIVNIISFQAYFDEHHRYTSFKVQS